MRQPLPISLLFFGAVIGFFFLYMIPSVGIFFLTLSAFHVPGFLINAGLIGLTIEALSGRVARAWVMVPATLYAAFYGITAYEHFKLIELREGYLEANARVEVPFSKSDQALVSVGQNLSSRLINDYDLDAFYTKEDRESPLYRSTRTIPKGVCDRARDIRASLIPTATFSRIEIGNRSWRRQYDQEYCAFSVVESPRTPEVLVRTNTTKAVIGLLPVNKVSTEIITPEGEVYKVRNGSVSRLTWYPWPVVGCAPTQGGLSCFAFLWRERNVPIISSDNNLSQREADLVRALGLKRRPESEQRPSQVPQFVLDEIQKAEDKRLQDEIDFVAAALSEPTKSLEGWRPNALIHNHAALSKWSNAILTSLEETAAQEPSGRFDPPDRGILFAELVASFPETDFHRFKNRILDMYRSAPGEHWIWRDQRLIAKLGDYGEEALPIILKANGAEDELALSTIEGLCRVGQTDAKNLESVVLKNWRLSPEGLDLRRTALFLTLRRLDIAPPPLENDRGQIYASLSEEWAHVSPESPPAICRAWRTTPG